MEKMSWSDISTLFGAALVLVGAVNAVAPLGGWAVVVAPITRKAKSIGQACRRRWERFRKRARQTTVSGSAQVGVGLGPTTMQPLVPPVDIRMDPEGFGRAAYDEINNLRLDISHLMNAIESERSDRQAAVASVQESASADAADAIARIRQVELSGVRWQLVGVLFVVAGFVLDWWAGI